jgi:aryl-alcohol dehydrogenase-like predicted oxidoreductase
MVETRALGTSGISTIPLMLGGNVFGWTADRAASFAVLDRFVERGGTLIDTADVYSEWIPGHHGGESERMIGEWLRARGRRDDVQIATKVGLLEIDGGKGLHPDHVGRAVDASLKRLGTDYIDLYFAHRDDPDTPQADALGAFARAIEAGKVRAIGASNFSADRLASALAASEVQGLPRYSVLEPHYNLIERSLFEPELQPLAAKENIGVVPYFALARGFLTGKYRTAADAGKSARGEQNVKFLEGKGAAVLEAMDKVAVETGAPLAAIAIAWLAAQPTVTAPIASATSVAQLDELFDALDVKLSADQIATLDAGGA